MKTTDGPSIYWAIVYPSGYYRGGDCPTLYSTFANARRALQHCSDGSKVMVVEVVQHGVAQ